MTTKPTIETIRAALQTIGSLTSFHDLTGATTDEMSTAFAVLANALYADGFSVAELTTAVALAVAAED